MKIVEHLKEGLKPIVEVIIPNKKEQWRLVIGFFLIYVTFSLLFCVKHKYGTYNEILNYDVGAYVNRVIKVAGLLPFQNIRHPYFRLLTLPVIVFCWAIKHLSESNNLAIFSFMLVINLLSALSVNIIYKYCVNFLHISKQRSFLACLVFALFAHALLLSFLPESFQWAMFGLIVLTYLTTDHLLNEKKIPLLTSLILSFYTFGVTLSNGAKWFVALCFYDDTLKRKWKIVLFSGITIIGMTLFSFCATKISYRLYFGEWISFPQNVSKFVFSGKPYIVSEMLFEPILFHHNYNYWGWSHEKPFIYHTLFPVITGIVFYSLLVVSILVNRKEKPVQLLLSFLGVDVLIHLICGFGISDLYIYCFHWLFIFPLLLGWLYKKMRNRKLRIGFDVLLIILCVAFAINNIPRLMELFR